MSAEMAVTSKELITALKGQLSSHVLAQVESRLESWAPIAAADLNGQGISALIQSSGIKPAGMDKENHLPAISQNGIGMAT